MAGGMPPRNCESMYGAAAAQIVPQKRIEYVALQHDHGAEAAQPVEVLQAVWAGFGFHPGQSFPYFWGYCRFTPLGRFSLTADSEMLGLIFMFE